METNMLTTVESPASLFVFVAQCGMEVLGDIEGAFDCASFQKLSDVARDNGADVFYVNQVDICYAKVQKRCCAEAMLNYT